MGPPAAITVDVEMFHHLPAYRRARGSIDRVDVGIDGLEFIRTRMSEHDVTSTFFVVGDLTENHGHTLKRLGVDHEIASHSMTHPFLSDIGPKERREELAVSRERLAKVSRTEVYGFRAPSFDFNQDHFQLLEETGYSYDSSLIPSRKIPGWYGGEFDQHRPGPVNKINSDWPSAITEFPVSVMPHLRLPISGTWLRFFGVQYTRIGMHLLARRGILPVLYIHPWEFVDLPEVPGVPKRVYFRTGSWMRNALEEMLNWPFSYTPLIDLLDVE